MWGRVYSPPPAGGGGPQQCLAPSQTLDMTPPSLPQPCPQLPGRQGQAGRAEPDPASLQAPSSGLAPGAQRPRAPPAHAPGPGRFVILPSRASSGKVFEECSNYLRSAREASLGPLVQEVTGQIPGREAPGPHAHPRLRPRQPLPQVARGWPRTSQPQISRKRFSFLEPSRAPRGRVGVRDSWWPQCSCLSNADKNVFRVRGHSADPLGPHHSPRARHQQGPHSLPRSDGSGENEIAGWEAGAASAKAQGHTGHLPTLSSLP